MGFSILGVTISGLVALVLLLIGIFGLFGKRTIGSTVRSVLGMIPLGNPKLWSAIILILGLAGGGLAFGWGYVSSMGSGIGTATGLGGEDVALQNANLECEFSVLSSASPTTINVSDSLTTALDSADRSHYTIYLKNFTNVGAGSMNGTLTCTSARVNIRQGTFADCSIQSDSFKSFTSTTDSNTYYILATSTQKSKVPGYTWQQTAYLNNDAVATATSDQEETKFVFAQDEVSQTLGFYFTLPGDTTFNYLRADTDPQDVRIVCDGQTVAKMTIVKQGHE